MGQSDAPVSVSSTWPRDVLRTPKDFPRDDANQLLCFLACPFDPPNKRDELLTLIQSVCDEIGHAIGADIGCICADQISKPGTIHADIWRHLQLADALIFDVTGGNGNVLLELGVAAACRSQDNVVVLRDETDAKAHPFLFDITPSRHLLYNSNSWTGFLRIRERLKEALTYALTPAPYKLAPDHKTGFPLAIDLRRGCDSADLLSPPVLHRRMVDDGLEFGSLYIFRNSWLTVGDDDHAQVDVEATMRFSDGNPAFSLEKGWIGIALRSQHFFANYGNLVFVHPSGSVKYFEPLDELHSREVMIGSLDGFDPSQPVDFQLSFGPDTFEIKVNEASRTIDLRSAPHVRQAGKVRLQTYGCRAVLSHLKVIIGA